MKDFQRSTPIEAANTASVKVLKTKSGCCLMSVLKSVTHILFDQLSYLSTIYSGQYDYA